MGATAAQDDPEPVFPRREPPSTVRGARTRAALVAAARIVFERDGYLDATLGEITRRAHCATGTFYTYFGSKDEILAAVLDEARRDMLHPGTDRLAPDADPRRVLEASNRAYLTAFRRNAKLMAVMEQVAQVDPRFARLRAARAEEFVARNAHGIADLQERGVADPALDPLAASRALSGMVSRFAYSIFVAGDGHADGRAYMLDEVVATVTRLWANALCLPDESRADDPRADRED